MAFQRIKTEKHLTFSRKIKKQQFKKFYASTLNSNFCFKFFKFFLIKQSMYLNRKIIYKLLNEELGFMFSLSN